MDTHNPLLLPDLFQNILDHLTEYHPRPWRYDQFLVDKDGRGTLLALALTCRDISGPSLDRLWRELASLKPLIRVYGGDLRPIYDTKKLTPPTSGELSIIRRYSPRVRTVYLRDTPSMLLLRHMGLQSSSFFPNLSYLVYDETHPRRFGAPTVPLSTLACLLTPKITSLETVFAKRVDGVQAFLRDLHRISPNLRTFTFEASPDRGRRNDPRQLLHHIPDFSRFKNLQHASLQAFIDHITFEKFSLSSLPRGISAAVSRNQSTSLETSLGPADIPFQHAKHVKLRVWDLDFVTNLLRPSHQSFDYIAVSIDGDRPTASSVDSFFKALAHSGHADSLQTIKLKYPWGNQFTPGHLSSDLPSLLTSFRHLKKLVIDLGNISIDDDQLANLGCLRSLEVLELTCWAASWPLVQRPTLHGVLSLAGSCQQLRELKLCVDARQVPHDADAKICNTNLKFLTFLDSPIDDSRSVAQFIVKHLPSVKRASPRWSVTESPWYNWGGWYDVGFKLHWGVDDERRNNGDAGDAGDTGNTGNTGNTGDDEDNEDDWEDVEDEDDADNADDADGPDSADSGS